MAAGTPRRWGTIAEAADRRQTSVKTIRRMIARGEIYAERFGPRLIRIDLSTVESAGSAISSATGNHETTERISDCIEHVVAAAPPLTPEQRSRLAAILQGGDA